MFRTGFQSAGVGLDLFLPEKQLLDEVFVVEFAIFGCVVFEDAVLVLGVECFT